MDLEKLFNPKSIAIVGASPSEGKIGNVIMKNLFSFGYEGEIFLINPKYDDIFSQRCYASLGGVEKKVELAVIAIPADLAVAEIEKNAEKIKNFVVISAGFSETDEKGKERERRLFKIAQDNQLNILGPNCLGFIVPKGKLNASFAGGMPQVGNISFVSQSGALAVALMDIAEKENFKFSSIISIGNKMILSENEILEYLSDDKKTEVIGMYLEGIKDGEKFKEIAQKVSLKKPVIILKAGKNEKTQKAIASHTGALAGNDEIVSAVFRKLGIMRANSLQEFFDLFELISNAGKEINEKVAVITNAGGVGVLTADAFSSKDIRLAEISGTVRNKLSSFLPEEASLENPIDLLGDAQEDRYKKVLEIITKVPDISSIICVLTPQDQTPVEKIAQEIINIKQKTKKNIVTVFLGGERVQKAIFNLKENGICNFDFPDNAVNAINKYFCWNEFRKTRIISKKRIINSRRRKKVLTLIENAQKEGRQALYFSESAEVMEMYGIKTVDSQDAFSSKNNIQYPVTLKVDSDKTLHKTDKGGLILNIENRQELKGAIRKMEAAFPGDRLIVQSMQEKGNEIIIGIKRDDIFGPVIMYGLGGIYAEFLKQVDYLIPPLNINQIESSLLNGRLGFLFAGARGQKEYNAEELAQILSGIMVLSLEIPEIKEFDINPLFIYNNRKEAVAVDVKIIF